MAKYRIKVYHELYCDYIVESDSEEAAIEKLCRHEDLWTSYGDTWGPHERALEYSGIECDTEETWVSGPFATSHDTIRLPKWDVEAEEEEE